MDGKKINVLFLEDSEDDFQLVLRELSKGDFDVMSRRVASRADLEAALQEQSWDVVIADYAMPGFTGLAALKAIKATDPSLPVILVSGTIGEAIAVEAMRAGAQDYVMKDNLKRLLPAVERELQEAEKHRKGRAVEAALQDSEFKYRELVELLPQTIFEFDLSGNLTFVNSSGLKMFGFTREDFKRGITIAELFEPCELERLTRKDGNVFAKRRITGQELAARKKDGTIFPTIIHTSPILQSKSLKGWRGTCIDISEWKQAEAALKQKEEQFRTIFENAPLMINSFDKNGRCELWNQECMRITGMSIEDVNACPDIMNLFYPEQAERERATEHMRKADGTFQEFVVQVQEKARHQLWANFRLPDGALISMGHDITERIHAEKAIRLSEEKYRSLFETSRDGIVFFSLDGTVEDANHAYTTMLQYDLEELKAMTYHQYTPEKWYATESHIVQKQILARGYSDEYEKEYLRKDGTTIPVKIRAWLVRDEQGKPQRMLSIVRDLTEQKQTEQKLQFTQFSIDRSGDGVFWLDPQGNILDVNKQACHSLQYARQELLKMTVFDIVPDFLPEIWHRRWQEVKRYGSRTFESQHKTSDGTIFPVEIQANYLEYQGQEYQCAFARDITARKGVEQQLTKLSHAVEQSPVLVMITDPNGAIEYVNPKFEEITGYGFDEVLGKNPRMLKSGNTPDETYKALWQTITSGKVWRGELQNQKKNGDLYWEAVSISPITNSEGAIAHFLAVKEDVTEKKRLEEERRQFEAQLLQSQKLETIGTLAGGIAHDFNNLLTPIIGYSDMALNDAPEGSQIQADLREINKAASRAKELVHQILTFSRQLPQERKPIRLQHVLKEALNLMRATIPSYIEIKKYVQSGCQAVLADATQLHQVIINLCTNSYHAMRDGGGTLTLRLSMVEVDEAMRHSLRNLSAGNYVCLEVSDTGAGMNESTMKRIFEPFFTTKTIGEGTGLGLSVVHGIILSYGGDIAVHSKVGEGTTFKIYLPPAPEDSDEAAARAEPVYRGTERVLLVDDEIAVAEVGKRLLTRLGYSVTVKHNGLDALECFREKPEDFDILITDQTMPKMTGYQLAAQVRKYRKDIPILLISGYNESVDSKTAKAAGIYEYLLKPINASQISKVIRQALEQKGEE